VLTLQANGDGKLKWYADASFAVHPGAIMTMGKGAVQLISRKQKMNSQSSTEAEFVGKVKKLILKSLVQLIEVQATCTCFKLDSTSIP
jgi:hypothetical protein